ncbi:dolichol kinase-like [Macrosteles quadrilineatus]|nr:dolichol kinase-like [Macrosteles quadrilineatus]
MLFTFTPVTCIDISTKILQVGMTGLMIFCGCVYNFPRLRKPMEFYSCLAAVLVIIVVLLHVLLNFSSVLWIFYLATEDILTLKLVASWVLASVVAVVAAMTQVKGGRKASTIVRKYFHLLAVAVYLPGLLLNPCLLYLASGIIFAIFVGLEIVRVAKVAPVAEVLDSVFLTFVDEKDAGPVALTPLCLMAGVSAPLWLHPAPASSPDSLPPLLAGLLSVGVGDTAASVCGSLFGRHKWPDSQRTKEGSAACFISQLFFVIAMIHFGYIPRNNLLQPIVAISAVSWVEATTDQIDNLALPLLMYILML